MRIKRDLTIFWFIYFSSSFFSTYGAYNFDTRAVDFHPNWRYLDRENCGQNVADRIIGGRNAVLGQYPWLAQIGYSMIKDKNNIQFSCGGSLISDCWVVTAAHCVTDIPRNIYVSGVRLGEYDVKRKIDCSDIECADPTQDFAPIRVLMHKYYGTPKFQNDIALIQIDRPIIRTKWVTPICLPYGPLLTQSKLGKIVEVAGWGVVNIKTADTGDILQTVKLQVVSNANCQKAFKKKANISDRLQICVGGIKGYDSCGGDSGGPMMMVNSITTPKYYVFGIVSFGSKFCGAKTTPGVYTNIAMYMKWILDQLTPC